MWLYFVVSIVFHIFLNYFVSFLLVAMVLSITSCSYRTSVQYLLAGHLSIEVPTVSRILSSFIINLINSYICFLKFINLSPSNAHLAFRRHSSVYCLQYRTVNYDLFCYISAFVYISFVYSYTYLLYIRIFVYISFLFVCLIGCRLVHKFCVCFLHFNF